MNTHRASIGARLTILSLAPFLVTTLSTSAVSADSSVPAPEAGQEDWISPYQIEDIFYNSLFALGSGCFEEADPQRKTLIAITFYDLAWKYWVYTAHLGSDRNRIVEARLPQVLRLTKGIGFEEFLEDPIYPTPPEAGAAFRPVHYRIRNRNGELRSFSITTPEQFANAVQAFRAYLQELDDRYEEKLHPSLRGEKNR